MWYKKNELFVFCSYTDDNVLVANRRCRTRQCRGRSRRYGGDPLTYRPLERLLLNAFGAALVHVVVIIIIIVVQLFGSPFVVGDFLRNKSRNKGPVTNTKTQTHADLYTHLRFVRLLVEICKQEIEQHRMRSNKVGKIYRIFAFVAHQQLESVQHDQHELHHLYQRQIFLPPQVLLDAWSHRRQQIVRIH